MSVQPPQSWRPLRIAMVGQKGLPATYGGVEHHVEEIGRRLAQRGHRVTVYNRRSYGEPPPVPYLGMNIQAAPTVASKHLDAIVHSASSTALALASPCDVVHYHALGPGLIAPLPRYASRSGVVQTVHGLDQERGKWGRGARSILELAHWLSARVPDETVVVSRALRDHYLERFGKQVHYIPNGMTQPEPVASDGLAELGVTPQQYVLYVGRIVPEKAVAELLEAYRGIDSSVKLVVAGDSSFTDDYNGRVRRMAAQDPRVVLAGYTFGDRLNCLYQHARLFVQPSLVEGLPLTLLEAVSHALPVVASDIPPHLEVLDPSGSGPGPGHEFFSVGSVDSLRQTINRALVDVPGLSADLCRFRSTLLDEYNWDRATDELEQVYLRVAPPASPVAQGLLQPHRQLARSVRAGGVKVSRIIVAGPVALRDIGSGHQAVFDQSLSLSGECQNSVRD